MKAIGCLGIIVLVVVVVLALTSASQDASDEQKARRVGEKAHRGWNRVKDLAGHAKEGWKTVPDNPPRKPRDP